MPRPPGPMPAMNGDQAAGRFGIAAAGNFIVDQIKVIDGYPAQDHLANILAEDTGAGGAPYNVLAGLRALDADLPLQAIGAVGHDQHGQRIRKHLGELEIDCRLLRTEPRLPTSYTDVMSCRATGRRTFFHNRGANRMLVGEDFEFDRIPARLLHLGYLMLLDGLDAAQAPDCPAPVAARVLEEARAEGLATSLDLVSDFSGELHRVVPPCLPHTDYLIINELEAGALCGLAVRGEPTKGSSATAPAAGAATAPLIEGAVARAARELLEAGVRQHVVIHAPEGAWAASRAGGAAAAPVVHVPSLRVPAALIAGSAGAGDAFCGGMLYGLHAGWPLERCLWLATAHAAQSLLHVTTTGALLPLSKTISRLTEWAP